MESFEELEAWKLARALKQKISGLADSFPDGERYLLTNQIIRSSRSIGSNIAEGFGRYHFKENSRFCLNARGSLFETLNHLIDAYDEEYIDENTLTEYRQQIMHCNKVLNGYIAYLKKQGAFDRETQ